MRNTSKLLLQTVCMLLLLFGFQFTFAQGNGSVMGQVVDPATKEPLPDITVVFDCEGVQHAFTTNEHGYYYASHLPAGMYNVTAAFMSNNSTVTGVKVGSDDQKVVDIALNQSIEMGPAIITEYHNKLIDPVGVIDVIKMDRPDIKNQPVNFISDITATQAGVTEINGVFYIHGAREGSLTYYVDGGPVMAAGNIPLCGLESYTLYDGYIPAKYGDAVGGVLVLETRNYFSETH